MSREKKERNRMSSIARRINGKIVWKQFSSYFWMDLGMFLLASAAWCVAVELNQVGDLEWRGVSRWFEKGPPTGVIYYVVDWGQGRVLKADMMMFLAFAAVCLCIAGTVQFLSLLFQLIGGAKKIRYQLHPLNELAKKAEELSSIAFDESKFHLLEDAISNVDPEEGRGHLHIGDKELQGLEQAVNNLIDRMRDSYRQQSRFVSDASHELRTPISVIQGYANMLDRWGKEDETVLEEGIGAIKHESEHMSALVEQLLFLARSDSGKNQMMKEKVELGELVREVYEESRMIDENHRYSLSKPEGGGFFLTGDATMLKQTMRILADNAMKYSREGDEILFSVGKAEEGKNEIFFSVQDSGEGMKEQDVAHIFERFYRSDTARNSSTGGSGLGLSIAKRIVDKHRGHFEILSREGLGTRITVWLPVKE